MSQYKDLQYSFDNTSIYSKVVDAVGNQLTIHKTVQPSAEGIKKFGGGIQFLGTGNGYLVTTNTINLGGEDFCIEAWVYYTDFIQYGAWISLQRFMAVAAGSRPGQLTLGTYQKTSWYVSAFDSAGQGRETYALGSYDWDSLVYHWNHIAFTFTASDSTLRCYVNGVENFTGSFENRITECERYVWIGTNSYQPESYYGFIGTVSNVRISSGTTRYTNNFTPPTAAFVPDDKTALLLYGTELG